jgi:hypothetical protein
MIELRAQQVLIDTPRLGAPPFAAIWIQRVIFDSDGKITQTINKERMINKSIMAVGTEVIPNTDPVIQSADMISVAGVGIAIEKVARSWILEAYPEAYLEGDRVLIDDNNS